MPSAHVTQQSNTGLPSWRAVDGVWRSPAGHDGRPVLNCCCVVEPCMHTWGSRPHQTHSSPTNRLKPHKQWFLPPHPDTTGVCEGSGWGQATAPTARQQARVWRSQRGFPRLDSATPPATWQMLSALPAPSRPPILSPRQRAHLRRPQDASRNYLPHIAGPNHRHMRQCSLGTTTGAAKVHGARHTSASIAQPGNGWFQARQEQTANLDPTAARSTNACMCTPGSNGGRQVSNQTFWSADSVTHPPAL